MLGNLPIDTGLAFVLVQHLDRTHESALTELLARATAMPVREITQDQLVKPNHVYVIPPNADLSIEGGVLKLHPRAVASGTPGTIDFFLESLARDQGERAIGVILSGAATDGSLGLEAIKADGGFTFAQDASAKYDSMPRSAIAAGCVDLVLKPKDIARELAHIAQHPLAMRKPPRASAPKAEAAENELDGAGHYEGKEEAGFKKILLLLRSHSGVDFSLYRRSTIERRVARRMVLTKQRTTESYARLLRGNAKELDALYADALIGVTTFFRNPEAFETLGRTVFPSLLHQRTDDPVRAWVLGCSTGQEAYSIAMTFVEAAERAHSTRRIQVFATDAHEAPLATARHGLYARSVVEGVSPGRLRRFFVEEEGGYRISKALRQMVVFARQDLISDPPFSRLDLVSCRNVLIYLDSKVQKTALAKFHYALKPGGFLFLGGSESVGTFTDLFEPVDKSHRIYARQHAPTPSLHLPQASGHGVRGAAARTAPVARDGGHEAGTRVPNQVAAQREADRVTMAQFAPPAVLVDANLQVLQFRGTTGAYLSPPAGKASFDVLKMARSGLALPLHAAITRARKGGKPVRTDNVRMGHNDRAHPVTVQVIPLRNLDERYFLITFQDAGEGAAPASATTAKRSTKAANPNRIDLAQALRRIAEMEQELTEAHKQLQSALEEHEAASEELQASNEEGQSANEELQSLNEELQTSKEELESANEELVTVNEELASRNSELNRVNGDLRNLQLAAHLPIVLLARDLTIRSFSAEAEKHFSLRSTDIGRPIGNIRHDVLVPDLEEFVAGVIDSVSAREREVQDKRGQWYSLRVLPYLTLNNKVDGAVVVLLDISTLKRTEALIAAARDLAESTIDTVREPLLVLDAALHVESANRAFYRAFGVEPRETIGRVFFELGGGQWDLPALRKLLVEVLPTSNVIEDFAVNHEFKEIGDRSLLLNARRIEDYGRKTQRILLAIEDITHQVRAAERKDVLVAELNHRVKNTLAAVQALAAVSARGARSVKSFMSAFEGRLRALAGANDLLLSAEWIGADMAELAHATLKAHDSEVSGTPRIAITGPSLQVHPEATLALVLILHELATNAAKYGALSTPDGRLDLTWEVMKGASVRLQWKETGGPKVSRPSRTGFGTRLIERSAQHELHGRAVLEFSPTGLTCVLTFPLLPIPPRAEHR